MVKPVRVRFVVEPTSLKDLEKLFDKFKLTWDDKVFKKVDDLGDSLDKLQKIMHDVWRQNAYGQYQKVKGGGTGGATGGGNKDLQAILQQVTKEFDKSTKALTTSIDKTTKAISDLELGAGKATDGMMSFEERMDLLKESTNKELMAIEARQQGDVKRYKMREALSDKEEAGRKQRLASRGWMNMLGGTGSIGGQLTKIIEPFVKDLFKPMQQIFKLEEFQKTPAGIAAEKLKYNTSPAFPMARIEGQAAYQKAGIDDPDKARAGGTGIFGRARRWMGGRAEAGEKGGIAGMVGGAKGMAAIGGAMVGIKLIQKGVALGIESSPMMQQMLKLWKFGIMMIFRPIGDFFGFFLRPIFVMLLRKFIIPFYQEYLPIMQKMGNSLGEDAAQLLQWIVDGIKLLTLNRLTTDRAIGEWSTLNIKTSKEVNAETIAALDGVEKSVGDLGEDAATEVAPAGGIGSTHGHAETEGGGGETLTEQLQYLLNPTSSTNIGEGSLAQDIYNAIVTPITDQMDKEPTMYPWEQNIGTEGRVNPRDKQVQAEIDRLSSDIKIVEAENQIQRGDIIIAPIINVDGTNLEPEELKDEIIDKVIEEVTRGQGRYK